MTCKPGILRLALAAALLLAAAAGAEPPPAGLPPPANAVAPDSPALPLQVGPDLMVVRTAFGIIARDDDEQFVETTDVPAVEGQLFGWVVEFAGAPDSVRWEERLTLPSPPADWGGTGDDPDIVISADGLTATSHGEEMPDEGVLSRFSWALADGDPPGDYLLEVAIEGRLVARFRFHVAAPVHAGVIVVQRARRAASG